jgi:hypothetical protein
MKTKVILIITILCAFAGNWQTAWANPIFVSDVWIIGHTNGSQYACAISGPGGTIKQYGPSSGTSRFFNEEFSIGSGITMSLVGSLNFTNASNATDVNTGDFNFSLVFTSTEYYFAGATVTTLTGAGVSGCTVNGTYTKTLSITIPNSTSFGKINLTMATRTPLNYCTISGIDDIYVDYGEVCPEPIVTLEDQTLQKDVDYTLSYTQGTVGRSVTVTGTGDYVGWKSQHYSLREPALTDLHSLGTNIYEIATQQDLDYLARIVNGKIGVIPSNNCKDLTFRQTADIAYGYTTDWNADCSENNFTPIGGYGCSFRGTFDGQGHTISGIRVWKTGVGTDATSLGLFGYVADGGTVKNVVLSDAKIAGYENIGGIVGYIARSVVSDCYVYHTFVRHDPHSPGDYIAGYQDASTITRSYYRACEIHSDWSRKHNIFTLSAGAGVVLPTRTDGTIVNASLTTYADGIALNGSQYYTAGTDLALSYNGNVPQGYEVYFSTTGGALNGSILTMPAADVEVTAIVGPAVEMALVANQATLAGQTKYWATFYHPTRNCTLPAGAQAFIMKSDHALYRIGDGFIVPAGCAVVIMADSASIEMAVTEADAPSVTGNILQGTSASTTAPAGAHVLSQLGETFGFFEFTGTIPANKAYYVE